MEPGVRQDDVQQFHAVFFVLPALAAAPDLSGRAVRQRQGHHRPRAVRLRDRRTAREALQRIHRRHLRPQEGADGLFLSLLHLLRRLPGSGHAAALRRRPHLPRPAVRLRDRRQQHRSYRRATLLAPQRGDRLLRPEQQSGDGFRAVGRHLALLADRRFPPSGSTARPPCACPHDLRWRASPA